ncbi:MAG: SMP-30/gluconolactonase/LRE family protein [Acidobacteria bacterium]|nr:MAG: SMP-30/gluconolactonase/LRE family protein [Acidobacteriota bacterium]
MLIKLQENIVNQNSERSCRRSFLKTSVLSSLGLSAMAVTRPAADGISELYAGLKSGGFFESDIRTETRLPDDASFTEGPAASPDGLVYFTNIPASRIYRWDPDARELTVFRENSGKANGLAFDHQGRLLVCEQVPARVTRIDIRTGQTSVVAERFQGAGLEPPNDLAIDRHGRIYFSSRPSSDAPTRGGINGVYRVNVDGGIERILSAPDVQMPNGVALSPDERFLYVVESHPDEGHNRHIRSYPLNDRGELGKPDVLIDFYPGRSGDGMCVDSAGNLYVAAGLHKVRRTSETLDTRPGIHVISPRGQLLAFAKTPVDTITNCTFGGKDRKTLFVTCGPFLLSIRTIIPG